jgi:hypothetical protein
MKNVEKLHFPSIIHINIVSILSKPALLLIQQVYKLPLES